jgi:hypothetical protein
VGKREGISVEGDLDGVLEGASEVGKLEGSSVLGCDDGVDDGIREGSVYDGDFEGVVDGPLVAGAFVGCVDVGKEEGEEVGKVEDGYSVGLWEGFLEGPDDGIVLGKQVGWVGLIVGQTVGSWLVGHTDGCVVGALEKGDIEGTEDVGMRVGELIDGECDGFEMDGPTEG